MIRFFIALEIPDQSRAQLEEVQQKLKQVIPQLRLTDPEKVHLTVAFVGEQNDNLQPDLVAVIQKATWEIAPFEVTPAYIDGFPNLHHSHTFWVGVKGDIDKLFIIRERVKDGLARLGIPTDERRYIPHIAIAKTAKGFKLKPPQEVELERLMQIPFDPIAISSIKLFASLPEHGFHTHNTLAEIKLGL
ncbi:RNA 2',3'-cyclic phosphodiesterase [Candidatus Daviesbacteria bacterium]|nr:RNA 2',3'-cyclic phosphodiesterase [Candidatus Daviesbacteria bacterium]